MHCNQICGSSSNQRGGVTDLIAKDVLRSIIVDKKSFGSPITSHGKEFEQPGPVRVPNGAEHAFPG